MLNSIKSRLSLWFLLAFSIFAIGLGLYLYKEQKIVSLSAVDRFLQSKSQFFASLIEVYRDGIIYFEPVEKKPGIERAISLYDIPLSGYYYQIFFENGTSLAISPSLKNHSLPLSIENTRKQKEYFETITGPNGEPLRLLTQKVTIKFPHVDKGYTFIIQSAGTLEEVYIFLNSLRKLILYSIPIALLFSGLGGLLIAWLSLRPLKEFSHEVGDISAKNMDKRVHEDKLSEELKEFAKAFNATMDRLEISFKEQKRFISDASHELRSPTSIIKSYCEIPLRKERTSEEYTDALKVILDNTERMEGLIEDLLTISSLEQKKASFNKERLSINALLNNIASMMRPIAEQNKIDLKLNYSSGKDVYLMGNKDHLIELLVNIVDNAIKYNRKGGVVIIDMEDIADRAVIKVSDTGIGVSPGEREKIFQRFYRSDPSRSRQNEGTTGKQKGTGLGLSIAKDIAVAHQGTIEIENKIGEGTTFIISLPRIIDQTTS